MRIAIVSHSYPPARLGGAEIYTEAYARALVRAGHEVFVFAAEKNITKKDGTAHEERRDGIVITWFINNLFYNNFAETYSRTSAVAPFHRFLNKTKPDLVHFQHLMDVGAVLPRAAADWNAQLPIGMTLHDYWFTCPRFGQRFHPRGAICKDIDFNICANCMQQTPWRQPPGAAAAGRTIAKIKKVTGVDVSIAAKAALRKLRKKKMNNPSGSEPAPLELASAIASRFDFFKNEVYPYIHYFHSPTHVLAGELVKFGLPEQKLFVVPLGLELDLFKKVDRTASQKTRVAFHGQLTFAKAPDLLIRAWLQLPPETRARATLTIRGAAREPGYFELLESAAREAGARIEPAFERRELANRLSRTDLLVVPSVWWENSPLAILEAFAARVPVLVADLGGMAELVHEGRGGFRFAAGDSEALALALGRILSEPALLASAASAAPAPRPIDADAAEHPPRIIELARRIVKN
ncbi:MAG: glycosyltransferase [Planctomycetota bacterium]